LYYYNAQVDEKVLAGKNVEEEELKFKDMEKEICPITGSVLSHLKFGDQEFWNIDKTLPKQAKPVEDPLPSDWRFREDLIWLKYGNLKNAEDWKLRLEEQQRYDRKMRGADK